MTYLQTINFLSSHPQIPSKLRCLFVVLALRPSEEVVPVTIEMLAESTGKRVSTVQSHLRELRKLGLLECESVPESGSFQGVVRLEAPIVEESAKESTEDGGKEGSTLGDADASQVEGEETKSADRTANFNQLWSNKLKSESKKHMKLPPSYRQQGSDLAKASQCVGSAARRKPGRKMVARAKRTFFGSESKMGIAVVAAVLLVAAFVVGILL